MREWPFVAECVLAWSPNVSEVVDSVQAFYWTRRGQTR